MVQRYREQDYRYTGNRGERGRSGNDRYSRDGYSARQGNHYGGSYSGQGGYERYRRGARDTRQAITRAEQNQGRYARGNYTGRRKAKNSHDRLIAIVIAVLIACIAIGVVVYMNTRPITIIVNGKTAEVAYNTTYRELHDDLGLLTASYGDFVAVDGSVLSEGEGNEYTVYDNNEKVENLDSRVKKTSVVTDERGTDIVEDYDVTESTVPHTLEVDGGEDYNFYKGSLTLRVYDGADGVEKKDTGRVSGITVDDPTSITPVNRTYRSISPEISSEKVIALTFDDGPSPEYTEQILGVLQAHGAKATFFENGTNIEEHPELSKELVDAGMQVASHGYVHGGGEYPYYDDMTPEQVVEDMSKNQATIQNATGTTCTIIRPPGGNFDYDDIVAGQDYFTCAVGWDIDPEDWSRPGATSISNTVISESYSGAVVLMHDGGGDRSQTVEALDTILTELSAQGYRFVTIDELIELERQELIAQGEITE